MKASATQLKESAQVLDKSTAMHPKQQQYHVIVVLCLILKPSVTRDYPELSISGVSGWNMKDISKQTKLDLNPDTNTCRHSRLIMSVTWTLCMPASLAAGFQEALKWCKLEWRAHTGGRQGGGPTAADVEAAVAVAAALSTLLICKFRGL